MNGGLGAYVALALLAAACKSSAGIPLDHRPSDPPCPLEAGVGGPCAVDTDCPDGGVCICATPGDGTSPGTTSNACLPAGNCRLDSDCSDHYCSPSSVGCSTAISYYCHTPGDDCSNDGDCRDDQFCQYSPGAGKWTCVLATACNQ